MEIVTVKNKTKNNHSRYFKLEQKDDQDITLETNNGISDEQVIQVKNIPLRLPKKFHKTSSKDTKKYLGATPIDPKLLETHSRESGGTGSGVKTKFFKQKLKRKVIHFEFAQEQAARTDILLKEEEGFLVDDDDGLEYLQNEIVRNVDITAATKRFDLHLEFGPYHIKYTRNGRHLLLAGKRGHVAAFDWLTKSLNCEINVMEEVTNAAWLHIETMFAVSQKNWVHIYDNKGKELHCLKQLHRVNRMEFLPYHFLLSTASDTGQLAWLDVSVGEVVANYNSKLGPISLMAQNFSNGVISVGGSKGVVSMWSPTVQQPLAQMLCHPAPLSAIAIEPYGKYMATSGMDRTVKIWDIRELSGPLAEFKGINSTNINISQTGLISVSSGNTCLIYKDPIQEHNQKPYLRQLCNGFITGLEFCPYEDVLGISSIKGFTSILVPGSGEPNFDAREANPYRTKSQRKEYEVHALLEKIPAEFIALDPNKIVEVDIPTLKEKLEARTKLIHLKPPKIDYKRRNKAKKKEGSANMAKNKKIVQQENKRKFNKEMTTFRDEIREEQEKQNTPDFISLDNVQRSNVLNRFKPKKHKSK